jgi:hypothetical protein
MRTIVLPHTSEARYAVLKIKPIHAKKRLQLLIRINIIFESIDAINRASTCFPASIFVEKNQCLFSNGTLL